MKSILYFSFIFIVLSINTYSQSNNYETGRLIVQLQSDHSSALSYYDSTMQSINSTIEGIDSVVTVAGIFSIEKTFKVLADTAPSLANFYTIKFSEAANLDSLYYFFKNSEEIITCEKLPLMQLNSTPVDEYYDTINQWYLNKIQAESAWDISKGGYNTRVAIIDDGFYLNHQDLKHKVWVNYKEAGAINDTNNNNYIDVEDLLIQFGVTDFNDLFLPSTGLFNGVDDDGNGYIDDIFGWDAADLDCNSALDSTNIGNNIGKHGTMVAGTAVAETKDTLISLGVASVGWNCSFIPIKWFPSNAMSFSFLYLLGSLEYAYAIDAEVINISSGAFPFLNYSNTNFPSFDSIISLIYYNKSIIIASAGNSNSEIEQFPACHEKIITVAATDKNDTRWIGQTQASNYGNWIDLCAPGDSILTTDWIFGTKNDSTYNYFEATSSATPIVSGTVGLMKALCPQCNFETIKYCLVSSCDSMPNEPLWDPDLSLSKLGGGRLNAFEALKCIQNVDPIASFYYNDTMMCDTTSISFYSNSIGNIASFQWNVNPSAFASISSPNSQNTTITFNNPSLTYTITLTVIDTSITTSDSISTYIQEISSNPIVEIIESGLEDTLCKTAAKYFVLNLENIYFPCSISFHDNNNNSYLIDSITSKIWIVNIDLQDIGMITYYLDTLFSSNCAFAIEDSITFHIMDCECLNRYNNHWIMTPNHDLQFEPTLSSPTFGIGQFSPSLNYGAISPATISDAQGNLLFYTNGLFVNNKNHSLMTNGDSLLGINSSSQSAIILPKSAVENSYYIFTMSNGYYANTHGLRYHIVDMDLNNQNGEVVSKNNLLQLGLSEKITWVKKGDAEDSYWVITHSCDGNYFFTYLVNSDTIIAYPMQNAGKSINSDYSGQMKANLEGNLLACAYYFNEGNTSDYSVELYGFNNITGQISLLDSIVGLNSYFLEFSPQSNYLYACPYPSLSSYSKILRYDIGGQSISNIEIIGDNESVYYNLQLAPDKNRILTTNLISTYQKIQSILHLDSPNPYIADNTFDVPPGNYIGAGFSQLNPTDYTYLRNDIEVDVNCECQSTIIAQSFNGCSPYSYQWKDQSDSIVGTSNVIFNICSGVYYLETTDNCGCVIVDTVYVDFIAPTTNISFLIGNPTCYGYANGYVDAIISGGTLPYTYLWSTGAQSQDLVSIPDGNYSLTVIDNNFCEVNDSVSISNPVASNVNVTIDSISHPSCPNFHDGSINLTISGDVHTIIWSNALTNEDIDGLSAGVYYLSVYNSPDCSSIDTFTLIDPPIPSYNLSYSDSACSCSAVASISPSTHSYYWSNGDTGPFADSICGNSWYYVTISYGNSCELLDSFFVIKNDIIVQEVSTTLASCTNDGTAWIDASNISGGVLPYTYEWSFPTQYGDTAIGLSAGKNMVLIADSNGCHQDVSFTISDSIISNISSCVVISNASCPGGTNGGLSLNTSLINGTPPYILNWSSNISNPILPIETLTNDNYFLEINDANGCYGLFEFSVGYNYILDGNLVGTSSESCDFTNDGEIELFLANGTNLDSIFVNSVYYGCYTPNNSVTISGLNSGLYDVLIMDSQGCVDSLNNISIGIDTFDLLFDLLSIYCAYSGFGYIDLTVNNPDPPFYFNWSINGSSYASSEDINHYGYLGTYQVTVENSLGCEQSDSVTFISTDSLAIQFISHQPSCPHIYTGKLETYITGGAPPYSYLWSTGDTTNLIDSLPAGYYAVTVVDYYGCEASAEILLSNTFHMNLLLDPTPPSCPDEFGNSIGGRIDLTVYSGVPGYSYNWSTGSSNQDLEDLLPGIYYVTVVDTLGCDLYDTISLGVPELEIVFDVKGQGCNGIKDTINLVNGSINTTIIGGAGNISYLWSDQSTTQNLENLLDGGWYYLTVTDDSLCSGVDSVRVGSDQTITLTKGWSLWSTYIDVFDNADFSQYFNEQSFVNDIIIMKDGSGGAYWPAYLVYNLGSFESSIGYQAKLDAESSFTLEGSLVCPEDYKIELDSGWRNISYLRTVEGPINLMLSDLYGNMEVAKDENGAIYWPIYSYNGIGNMYPGKGYQINMNYSDSLFYPANSNNLGTKTVNVESSYAYEIFTDDLLKITDKFMILGIPEESWDEIPQVGSEIGIIGQSGQLAGRTIFNGGFSACVIYGDDETTFDYKEGLSDDEAFSIVVGNPFNKSTKNYKVKNWTRGTDNFNFEKINVVGEFANDQPDESNPDNCSLDLFPNPTRTFLNIEIASKNSSFGELKVFDISGRMVFQTFEIEFSDGRSTLQINFSSLMPGIYTVQYNDANVNLSQSFVLLK